MRNKFRIVLGFFRENDKGQDLAEYCLITAFVALAACGIFYNVSGGVQTLWTTANTTLVSGSSRTGSPSMGDNPAGAPVRKTGENAQ